MTTPSGPLPVVLLAAEADDEPFLRRCLAMAAWPGGAPEPRLAEDPTADPHVARYLEGWGRADDLGLVARADGVAVGAAWSRRFRAEAPGYGFVGADVPELTLAVDATHRGRGIGRRLLVGALDQASAGGATEVSLSVDDTGNPRAAALYRAVGFREVGRDPGGSLTMVRATAPPAPGPGLDGCGSARPATAADGPALLRLREVMQRATGHGGDRSWPARFLRVWAEGVAADRMLGAVVDGSEGRPIAAALATIEHTFPGPGRPDGRDALVSSVATEPAWRGRGAARACVALVQDQLRDRGLHHAHLTAFEGAEGVYRAVGFTDRAGHAMRWREQPGA